MSAQTGRNWLLVVAGLGTAQTLAWASSYYLIAILADPMAREFGTSATHVFAAFSGALLIAAVVGPRVGRSIDAFGGRGILAASNLIFASGLLVLGVAQNEPILWLGWGLMGLGMGLGLYDAAFAALGRIHGENARRSITGITLLAGFASTVGWPLTAWGLSAIGWRYTCVGWALAHLCIGLPLNLLILPRVAVTATTTENAARPHIPMDRGMWLLGLAFAAGWLVAGAMAAHLPRILQAAGATPTEAIAAGMLIGPAQVIARVLEASFSGRIHPLLSARLCTLMHPIGVALLFLGGGGVMASAFVFLHGAGNGIFTIARGTVPLAVYGRENYGYRLGLLGAPARMAQAGAPLLFGVLVDWYGARVLMLSTALCLGAFLALMAVRVRMHTR